ncbi:MAG: TrkH family potassium uptake protein [Acidobacteriota bacterium]
MKRSISFSIITTFLLLIITGTLLLILPFSTHTGELSWGDALFTSVSAVTVTGLVAVNTADDFTLAGQFFILLLIQLGGLGFMTFSTLTILILGKSLSITNKLILENDFTQGGSKNIKDLLKKIIIFTFGFEIIGSVLLFVQFSGIPVKERIFSSVFHSVSAFCNAGFSVFSNGFESYRSNTGINLTISFLIVIGGLGFLVLNEILLFIRKKKSFAKFTLHSKLVLIVSTILILAGTFIIFAEELINRTNDLQVSEKFLSSFFHSVSARTAGFNTLDLNMLSYSSLFILLLLMFIGASPGSTGGGIKTTSAGLVFAYFKSRLKGRENVNLFYRTIPQRNYEKAFLMIIISFVFISLSLMLIFSFETSFNFSELLFEVVSAFGTVGLSLGITSELSLGSKIVIMVTMFIGRIGPLTLLLAMSRKESKAVFDYPEANIMTG